MSETLPKRSNEVANLPEPVTGRPDEAPDSAETTTESRWPTRLRRAGVGLLVVGVVLAFVAVSGTGMTTVVGWAADRFAPAGWSIEVGEVEGSWLSPAVVRGLEVALPGLTLSADSVEVRYSLSALVGKRVYLPSLVLWSPRLVVDPSASEAAADTPESASGGAWAVDIDEFAAHHGVATVALPDDEYVARSVEIDGGFSIGTAGLRLRLDTLAAVLDPFDDAPAATLSAAGRLEDGTFAVDGLSLLSERSELRGEGVVSLPGADGWFPEGPVDLSIEASPLDLRDLPVVLPEEWSPIVEADLTASRSADTIRFEMTGRGPARITSRASGRLLRPGTADGPAATFSLVVDSAALPGLGADRVQLFADISGSLESLDPSTDFATSGAFRLPGSAQDGDASIAAVWLSRPWRVEWDAEGRHLDPDSLRLRGRVSARSAGDPGDFEGRVEVETERAGRIAWTTELTLAEGRASGRGSVDFVSADDPVAIDVRRLTFSDVNVAAFQADLVETRLAGSAHLSVLLDPDAPPLIDLVGGLSTSVVGETRVDTVDLAISMVRDSLRGAFEAEAVGAYVAGDLRAALGDRISGRISNGSFAWAPVDSGSVEPDSVRASAPASGSLPSDSVGVSVLDSDVAGGVGTRLAGAFVAEGVLDSIGPSVVAELELDSTSALGNVPLDGGALDVEWGGGGGQAEGRLRLEAGGIATLVADIQGVDGGPAWIESAQGDATLRFSGTLPTGGGLDSLWVAARLDAGEVTVDGRVRPTEVNGGLTVGGDGFVTADSVGGRVTVAGGFSDLSNFLDSANAAVDTIEMSVNGAYRTGGTPRLDATLMLEGARAEAVRVDSVRLDAAYDSSRFAVNRLAIGSNVLEISGGGVVPGRGAGSTRIELEGRIHALDPVASLLEVDVLSSTGGPLRFAVGGTLDSLTFDTGVQLNAFAFGTMRVRDLSITASGGPEEVVAEVGAEIDDSRTGDVRLVVDPRPDRRTVRVEQFDFSLDEDEWSLTRPAVVHYLDGFTVDSMEVVAGPQRVAVDGGIDGAGVVDLRARIDSTNISTISDLAGFPGLVGWVDLDLSLTGPLDALQGRVDAVAETGREGRAPGSLELALDLDGRTVTVDGELSHPAAGPMTVDGTAPASLLAPETDADGSLDLNFRTDGFGIAWLGPFLDAETVRGLDGVLQADLAVRGTVADPVVSGPISVDDLGMQLPALGVEWTGGFVRGRGDGPDLRIDSAAVMAGGGRATASGTIGWRGLTEAPLDLAVGMRGFRAIHNNEYRARVDGDLDVDGTLFQPDITGSLELLSLDVYLDEQVADDGLEAVELSEDDLQMLRERFGYIPGDDETPPIVERINADLDVRLGRDSWVRKRSSPEMAIAFMGDLEVTMRRGEDLSVRGSVEGIPDRGFVEQFGRRFELVSGEVQLAGAPADARVDVEARYTIPAYDSPDEAEVVIVLDVEGTREDLRLTLSSQPSMENADIVAYLATGRPASASAGGRSGGGLVMAGTELALDRVASVLEDAAERSVGLDVVEVRREGLRGATLVAGKYLSPKLYVGFSQPVSVNDGSGSSSERGSEVELEYEAYRWLVVNIEGSGSALRFFLRGRRAY